MLIKTFQKIIFSISIGLLTVNSSFAQTCNANINPSTPTARFTPHGDGTVSDTQTKLIWQRCLVGQQWDSTSSSCNGTASTYSMWQQALNVAQGNWRVPNIKELYSIVEMSCYTPAINLTIFPDFPPGLVWSSTPHTNVIGLVKNLSFYEGDIGASTSDKYVLLVRSEQ